jgi:hypothetical protein
MLKTETCPGFRFFGVIFQLPSSTKICEFQRFGATAENWTSCRCARSRNRQGAPMFFRLKNKPEKTTPFHFLPVKSA